MIADQVKLLLNFLEDFRCLVRTQALTSLLILTEPQCIHAWTKTSITDLITKASKCQDPREQYIFLTILLKLSECPLTCHLLVFDCKDSFMELCNFSLTLGEYSTSSQALTVLSSIVSNYKGSENVEPILSLINSHIEGLLFCTFADRSQTKSFKKILKCGIKYSALDKNFAKNFISTVVDIVNDDNIDDPVNATLICETLCAICSVYQIQKFSFADTDRKKMVRCYFYFIKKFIITSYPLEFIRFKETKS